MHRVMIHHEAPEEIGKLSMDFLEWPLKCPPLPSAKPVAFRDQRSLPHYLCVGEAPGPPEETAAGFKVIRGTSNPQLFKGSGSLIHSSMANVTRCVNVKIMSSSTSVQRFSSRQDRETFSAFSFSSVCAKKKKSSHLASNDWSNTVQFAFCTVIRLTHSAI